MSFILICFSVLTLKDSFEFVKDLYWQSETFWWDLSWRVSIYEIYFQMTKLHSWVSDLVKMFTILVTGEPWSGHGVRTLFSNSVGGVCGDCECEGHSEYSRTNGCTHAKYKEVLNSSPDPMPYDALECQELCSNAH